MLLDAPGAWPDEAWWAAALPGAALALLAAGLPVRLPQQYWRYAGLPDLLGIAGAAIAGQLKQSIIDTNSPPLKEATIVAKGGKHGTIYNPKDPSTFAAKPLIDTGTMLNAINHQVRVAPMLMPVTPIRRASTSGRDAR